MNAKTLNAPQIGKMLVALASVVLPAAAGPVHSAGAGSEQQYLACNAPPACGESDHCLSVRRIRSVDELERGGGELGRLSAGRAAVR